MPWSPAPRRSRRPSPASSPSRATGCWSRTTPSSTSGVDHLLDRAGRLLYVGKAVRLRERLASYFTNARGHSARVLDLIRHTHDFHITETGSELAAALLEARQIRELKPPYNRQRKHLPRIGFLKLTTRGSYPRLGVTRRLAADRATYLGPFRSLEAAERAQGVLGRVFGLRTCAGRLAPSPEVTPCLSGQVGACTAPCAASADLAAAVAFVRQRFAGYQDAPLRREEVDGTAILAAWLRDRQAHEGILLPLDGPDAIVERLDELAVTVRDLRLPGPLPAIDGLA